MRAIAILSPVLAFAAFAQNPPESLTFEVATMKLHPPGPEGSVTTQTGGPGTSDPGRLTIVNRTLHRLLTESFSLKGGYQLQDPPALDQIRYDISAKIPAGATAEDVHVMLQNLLIERLKLKVRHEHQPRQVWVLLVGKGGPKFKHSGETPPAALPEPPASGAPQTDRDGFPIQPVDYVKGGMSRFTNAAGSLKITAIKQTMGQFVAALFGQTDHPIMDMTGLEGKFDFSVIFGAHWKSDLSNLLADDPGASALPRAAEGPSIFAAVQEQLGLKLESRKVPVDLVIVDSGQKIPAEN